MAHLDKLKVLSPRYGEYEYEPTSLADSNAVMNTLRVLECKVTRMREGDDAQGKDGP